MQQAKLRPEFPSSLMAAALLFAPLFAVSHEQLLALKQGVYVTAAASCKGAANAQILVWDGSGFSGAHSSRCKSHVQSQGAKRFQISTSCAAIGDGTPVAAGSDHIDTFSLARVSATRFDILEEGQEKASYRWCSSKSPG